MPSTRITEQPQTQQTTRPSMDRKRAKPGVRSLSHWYKKKLESWCDWLLREVYIWVGDYIKNWAEGKGEMDVKQKEKTARTKLATAGTPGDYSKDHRGELSMSGCQQRWQRGPRMGLCVPGVSFINVQSGPRNPTSAVAGEPSAEGSCSLQTLLMTQSTWMKNTQERAAGLEAHARHPGPLGLMARARSRKDMEAFTLSPSDDDSCPAQPMSACKLEESPWA